MKDYFVCHASADKDQFVRPIVEALKSAGMTYWLDEAEVLPGDSLTRKIYDGLASARFVLAVLTPRIAQGHWSAHELDTVFGQQAARGEVRVVPVLNGLDHHGFARLMALYPPLESVRWLRWEDGEVTVVTQLEQRLGRQYSEYWEHHHPAEYGGPVWVRVVAAPGEDERPFDLRFEVGSMGVHLVRQAARRARTADPPAPQGCRSR